MDCEQVKKEYKDYLLGKLPESESKAVADHIRDCVDCFVMDWQENGARFQETSPHRRNGSG